MLALMSSTALSSGHTSLELEPNPSFLVLENSYFRKVLAICVVIIFFNTKIRELRKSGMILKTESRHK